MRFPVIPSEARNPSSIKMPRKERFLTSQTPFGMTDTGFFSNLLKLHSPKIRRRALQLQSQLPTLPPLVPAPDQGCLRRFPAQRVRYHHFLTYSKSMANNRQAALWANIHGVTIRAPGLTVFLPLHPQIDARIQPDSRAHVPHIRYIADVVCQSHDQ